MVQKIYKFLNINEFSRDVMLTEEFYFGDWEKMNDPMEGYIPPQLVKVKIQNIK